MPSVARINWLFRAPGIWVPGHPDPASYVSDPLQSPGMTGFGLYLRKFP
jgi:hypothetical protein